MKNYAPYIGLALLAALPLAGLSSYIMHIAILVIMWSVIGMAWNLLGGFCGQVSFGHAAFFGVGAYTAGMLYSKLGLSAWWGVPASVVFVALFALLLVLVFLAASMLTQVVLRLAT